MENDETKYNKLKSDIDRSISVIDEIVNDFDKYKESQSKSTMLDVSYIQAGLRMAKDIIIAHTKINDNK